MTPDPPGPPVLGTKVHEVVRSSGRDYRGRHRRDRSRTRRVLPLRGGGTIGGREGGRAARPDVAGTGALFIYTIELKPTGGMRVLGPLLGPIVRSGLKKDLQKLRALLEADRPA